jgi:hypothetical protein
MACKASFQVFGDSGDGKTTLFGEFAEKLFRDSGGKIKDGKAVGGKVSRLYTADPGGYFSIMPYVHLGIVEVVDLMLRTNSFDWLDKGARLLVPDAEGKWVLDKARNARTAMFGFEGATAFGDELMRNMASQAAKGVNIGGQGAFNFKDGELIIGSNNQAHYQIAQNAIAKAVALCQQAASPDQYIFWSAMARRATDADTTVPILGPQLPGKALTSDTPRWFTFTFRLMTVSHEGQLEEHRLYFTDHIDKTAAGAKILGNLRPPLDGIKGIVPECGYISPASLVKAYEIAGRAAKVAEEAIAKRCQ